MISVIQETTKLQMFYTPTIVDNGNGTLSIPSGFLWLHGKSFNIAAYDPNIGSGAFALWVEKTLSGVDYLLDLTLYAEPVSLGQNVGALKVAWRDRSVDEISRLAQVDRNA